MRKSGCSLQSIKTSSFSLPHVEKLKYPSDDLNAEYSKALSSCQLGGGENREVSLHQPHLDPSLSLSFSWWKGPKVLLLFNELALQCLGEETPGSLLAILRLLFFSFFKAPLPVPRAHGIKKRVLRSQHLNNTDLVGFSTISCF